MTSNEFLTLLKEYSNKELVFEYQEGQFLPKAYHITEVKNVYIESVDCGGRASEERLTVVQLWHDGKEQKDRFMDAGKALEIFDKTNSIRPMLLDTEILFEYQPIGGNTSTYKVRSIAEVDGQVRVKIGVPATACKPQLEKGGIKCC